MIIQLNVLKLTEGYVWEHKIFINAINTNVRFIRDEYDRLFFADAFQTNGEKYYLRIGT